MQLIDCYGIENWEWGMGHWALGIVLSVPVVSEVSRWRSLS
ncbi:MAG: hypothetical protein V7K38_01140 [Nostoc sp.]